MPRKKTIPIKRDCPFIIDTPVHTKKFRKASKLKDPSDGIILPVEVSHTEHPYRLGNITITSNNVELNLTSEFSVQFKPESSCFILLKEINDTNEVLVKAFEATYKFPYDVLQYLSTAKLFQFMVRSPTLQSGENIIDVYLNPSKFISLKDASQPYSNRQKSIMYRVLQFFLKIEFDVYENNYLYDEEQVAKIYKCISNCYDSKLKDCAQFHHKALIPKLRPYQCQAVSWMLKREKEDTKNFSERDLHELYISIVLQDGHTVYFHKYGGFFVDQKYAPENSCKGGLLTDEMGLGKTLEVLACILVNPRQSLETKNNKVYPLEHIKNKVLSNKNLNLKLEEKKEASVYYEEEEKEFDEPKASFGCLCGGNEYKNCENKTRRRAMSTVRCITCNVIQHSKCMMYKPEIYEKEYICPFCWVNNTDVVPSPATLIISPASIIYQWEQEIFKHVKKNYLKVFMYQGVEHQKFVDPTYLANHDVVLVSYETLSKELTHVDLPYGSAGHSLRHAKKFLTIPSPLCCVEWWRICLDEAQMVESVTSKIAKMVGKLYCVNRWCVTGTPIKKSIEDLYGLFLFLEVRPYQEKIWWNEAIWKPFVNGNIAPLSSALKFIAWRTMKNQVLDQLGVPGVEEVTHKLEFSPIEQVFYTKKHSLCKRDLMAKIDKFDLLDKKLRSMDKRILSKVMMPMRILQQVCCHFQMTRENVEMQKSKMTTMELLAQLLKTSKYECEQILRKLIMALNGLGGIYVMLKDYRNAVETYEKALQSIEDNKVHIRTDATQQIHASYHLSNVLSLCEQEGTNIKSKFSSFELNVKVVELSQTYIEKHKMSLDICKKDINEISDEISHIMSNFKLKREEFPASAWWCAIFERFSDDKKEEFLKKLTVYLEEAPGKSILRNFIYIPKSCSAFTFPEFFARLLEMSEDLHDIRHKLKDKVIAVSKEPDDLVLNSAISCHLRPVGKSPKCVYCEAEDIFRVYETKLFRFEETKQNPSEEETVCFKDTRRGTQADSDLQLTLKCLLSYSRRICKDSSDERYNLFVECLNDGANELKLIDAFKKEFKVLRNIWTKCYDYVSQKDELEMAKISARLLQPGEKGPDPPVPYILFPHEVQPHKVQYHSEIIESQFQLQKKLGQLFYLQNLEKAENKNAPFEENCPICQQKLENSWSVLQCGHCFCVICIQQLLIRKINYTNNLGYTSQGILCPLCRQYTSAPDIYLLDNSKDEEKKEDYIPIKKFYSTKVNAVVRSLLQIKKNDSEAKSLVFSSFASFLNILENALKENDIKCLNFCRRKHFQNDLKIFKETKDVNTLLIPLNFGCNGLNITEATHVLLVEPVLDNSQHHQAIGRVHRIGQKKIATVHRFFIQNSIEESIYNAMKISSEDSQSDLTLQELKDLFKYI